MKLNPNNTAAPVRRRLFASLCWSLLATGCGAELATAQPRPVPKPDPETILSAPHPGYQTPAGTKQECLGRLVFDTPRKLEWGLDVGGSVWGRYGFTYTMRGLGERIDIGEISIKMMAPATREKLEQWQQGNAADKRIGIRDYETSIATSINIIERLEKNGNKEDPVEVAQAIAEYKADIERTRTAIAGLQRDWHPIEIDRVGALAYQAGPSLYAYLLHDGVAFEFAISPREGGPGPEARAKEFFNAVQQFRFRKLNEIPQERGVCIPYGFLPDDGTKSFHTEMSLRFADRPGVIYTLATGTVGRLGSEPTLMTATARAAAGLLGPIANDAAKRRTRSVGPRRVMIGALPAEQGGVGFNVSEPGKAPVENYSVYTGYGGWGGSQVLPIITVDMRSFTKEQEPSLKSNPPPFDESQKRLAGLLSSLRLRPTEPAMPELADLHSSEKQAKRE